VFYSILLFHSLIEVGFHCIYVFFAIVLFVSHFVLNIIRISCIKTICSLLFLDACPGRSQDIESCLKLVLLGDYCSRQPKGPPMAEEKRDDGVGDPFKMFLEEALAQQRNEMMDKFAHIL
jgi:hypothetical protein